MYGQVFVGREFAKVTKYLKRVVDVCERKKLLAMESEAVFLGETFTGVLGMGSPVDGIVGPRRTTFGFVLQEESIFYEDA